MPEDTVFSTPDNLEDKYEELVAGLDERRKNFLMIGLPAQFSEDSFYVMKVVVSRGVPVTKENFQQLVNAIKTKASAEGKYSANMRFKG